MTTDENHFNELQQKTRVIASGWILAGFGAIAYFIKSSQPSLELFSSFTMIGLVSLMVVVGLFALWVLDQLVYQRLLNANFIAGLYREFHNKKEPPIRTLMIIGSEYKGMGRWYNLFYFIPMLTFTLFSTSSWIIELSTAKPGTETSLLSSLIGVVLILITLVIWFYISSKNRDTPFYNLLEVFGNPKFEKIADPKLGPEICAEIIRKWQVNVEEPTQRINQQASV